jgi:hypothetical protein
MPIIFPFEFKCLKTKLPNKYDKIPLTPSKEFLLEEEK